jgi:tetratricopeptide (TPR) repeat protein
MFDAIRNWLEVRAAMKDERRLRSGQAMLNSLVVQDKLTHAAEMLHVGQRVYATATMDEVLERFPDEAAELPMTPFVLIGLGRLDDAERLTLRGIQRNPDSRDFARIYCEISDHRPDIAERLRRWGAFRRRYPAYGLGFRMEAAALLAAGQDDAAETLLAEGVSVVRDDLGLASDYARRAEARADWPQARRRWAVVLDTFDDPIGASRAANALAELGRIDQAEAELTEARRRFPLDAQIVDDLATLAERRGDIDAALLRWSELRRDLPHVSRGYTEAARLLRDRGDHAGADALITEGAGRSPREVNLQFTYAALAERQGDWAAAAERWKTNRARFPAHPKPASSGSSPRSPRRAATRRWQRNAGRRWWRPIPPRRRRTWRGPAPSPPAATAARPRPPWKPRSPGCSTSRACMSPTPSWPPRTAAPRPPPPAGRPPASASARCRRWSAPKRPSCATRAARTRRGRC